MTHSWVSGTPSWFGSVMRSARNERSTFSKTPFESASVHVDAAVGVEVLRFLRNEVQLDAVRVISLDRVQDDAIDGRIGVVLREAVVVAVDRGLSTNREDGLLEDPVRIRVSRLERSIDTRPVLRVAVLVHIPNDRAGQVDRRELRVSIVVRVRGERRDFEGLADLRDA